MCCGTCLNKTILFSFSMKLTGKVTFDLSFMRQSSLHSKHKEEHLYKSWNIKIGEYYNMSQSSVTWKHRSSVYEKSMDNWVPNLNDFACQTQELSFYFATNGHSREVLM